MKGTHPAELFSRFDGNPILTAADCPHTVNAVFIYTGYSAAGPLVCAAATRDFRTYERRGLLMPPEDKDAALFPCRIGGRWALRFAGGAGRSHPLHILTQRPRRPPGARFSGVFAHYP